MARYSYTATSLNGEKVSGSEIAKNERELAQILHQNGYVLTHSQKEGAASGFLDLKGIKQRFSRVTLTEKLIFIRNLKVMIGAGVALPRALDILSTQAKSQKFQVALGDIKNSVVKGQPLSASMAAHSDIFSELFINMIKSGEKAGTLEEVLSQLTLQMERDHDVRSKIKGALVYPSVIIVAMTIIAAFMLIFVVPQLAETFDALGVELPITTKIIIALGNFMATRWYVVLGLLFVTILIIRRLLKTRTGKKEASRVLLHLPILSGIVRKMNAALTTRTLASLLAAGIPIVTALEVTSRVLTNWYFRAALAVSAKEVQKGAKLSEVLERYENLYPTMVVQMIRVGEETGETTEILSKVADFFEEEVDTITRSLTSIIEPILMMAIGVMVGFFAISMFQPMYSVLGNI